MEVGAAAHCQARQEATAEDPEEPQGPGAPARRFRAAYEMTDPTDADIAHILLDETPDTIFVTISRAGAAWVNRAAVNALFPGPPIKIVPADPDSNPDNFQGTTQVASVPMELHVHPRMRVTLTKNINKDCDYVNGMGGTVLGAHRPGIRVRTDTGYIIMVFPWTEVDDWGERRTFYPLRVGYGHTLMKVQGATLEHMTLWLDARNVEAAAYVACQGCSTTGAGGTSAT